MFKWPDVPSPHAPIHELADFAELVCWQDSRASATGLSRRLGRLEENEYSDGVAEEDEIDRDIEDAYEEIERRQDACGNGYPFAIVDNGKTLQAGEDDNAEQVIYKYLLLATRLNMGVNRLHADIDGTQLFERLSADVGREYFGERAMSLVFGTVAGVPNFEERVNDLCQRLGEGGGFENNGPSGGQPKDGKLDIVVWKPFCDGLPGKLVGFGQCKTGHSWRDTLTQLQPGAFMGKWVKSPHISVPPVRMFFVSEALEMSKGEKYQQSQDGGLIFDRCRIVDFSGSVSDEVIDEVTKWTAAAAKATGLPV